MPDENSDFQMMIPTIILCKCGGEMSKDLSVIENMQSWSCKCGEKHIETVNPMEQAMAGLSEFLKANGLDIESKSF